MGLGESIRLALEGLRANKMRSILTMLGMISGMGAVIGILTVGNGLTGSITGSMSGLGATNITVSLRSEGDGADFMASMMGMPVLGLVENMSYVKCPDCGKEIKLFGESKLDKVAATYNLPVLARLPIDPAVASAVDAGAVENIDVSLMDNAVAVIEGR